MGSAERSTFWVQDDSVELSVMMLTLSVTK
jgi:hypothetical protein